MSTTGMEYSESIPQVNIQEIPRQEIDPRDAQKRKAVLIYSGGADSTTLLYKLIKDNFDVYTLTINYGQKHKKEIDFAAHHLIKNNLMYKQKTIDISDIGKIIGSSLTSQEKEVPQVYDANNKPTAFTTLKSTVVPFRNAIFISIAVGYAESIGADYVFYAAHRSDRGMYPDCRSEFVNAITTAAQIGTDNNDIKVVAPFVNFTKGNIIELGDQLGIDYSYTWSCYVGGDKHCGKCSSCTERKIAFKDADVKDPTEYEV